jgi:hypothetical protein
MDVGNLGICAIVNIVIPNHVPVSFFFRNLLFTHLAYPFLFLTGGGGPSKGFSDPPSTFSCSI